MRRHPAELPPEKDHGAHTLRVWTGMVVGLNGDDVFVELGPRMQGVISAREFDEPPEVGDVFDFTLRGQEEELWALSLRETKSLASWEEMEAGSLVRARVLRPRPGGLELKIGPLHAFMPRSQSGLARGDDLRVLVGQTITCEVIEVDVERQRVSVSRRLVQKRERTSQHSRAVASLEVGRVVHGRVTRIEEYGVFVRFGRGMEGLIHVSNLADERVAHPSDMLKEGDAVDAKILHIKNGGKRISLGLKQMHASPWKDLERSLYIDQIVEGTVTVLAHFGAFVSIRPGVEGLLHDSESGDPGRPLRDTLKPGQRLSLRVVALDCEAERLSLSRVHKGGALIQAGEAESARTFAELARENPADHIETNLGQLLKRALDDSSGAQG